MSSGKEFEDALMDALEEWVGDDGVPLLRKQSKSFRRGSFQMNQELDIMVDSPDPDYYIGIEAKARNTESRLGFYFSSDLNIDQIRDGMEYAEKSGRDYVVAVELRNYEGTDFERSAWVVPPELFIHAYEKDATKVSWEQIDHYGYCIGHDGEYEITREAIDSAVLDSPRFDDLKE